MRTTVVVGRIGPEGTEVAYRCTCGAWTNEEDRQKHEEGVHVSRSHRMCQKCYRSAMESLDPEPAA